MSLYGALFSGVAGLTSQAQSIGIISDNISNVNTDGYKSTVAQFETLVTSSGSGVSYSPGGVLGRSRANISSQGLLQATNNSTDVAISGAGFFVVNSEVDGTGTVSYTRAGSFRQDSTGNFRNAAGFYLQGWPLDRDNRLPGETGNANTTSSSSLTSVETINVSSFTGSAAATTTIQLSANLNAARAQLAGASDAVTMDSNSNNNFQITSTDIIVPTSTNSIARGDRFVIESGNGLSETIRYGGYSFSKNVTSGAVGDSGLANPTSPITLGNNPITVVSGDQTVQIRHANHGLTTGEVVTLSGVTSAIGGVAASDFNQSFVITVLTEDTYSVEISSTPTGNASGGSTTVQADFREFVGNILDASTAAGTFLGTTGTSGFSSDALNFTITTATTGTVTFTYTGGTPNTTQGQFNNLTTLATAINATTGLDARIVDNQLYVAASDANEAVTFANGNNVATGSGGTLSRGIDWVQELGLQDISAGTNRFATLQGLADVVNATSGFSATVTNPGSNSTISISVDDPLDTITIRDQAISTAFTSFSATESPFTTVIGSSNITLTHSSAHGYSTGDIVRIDPTAMTNYPAARTYNTTPGAGNISFATTATSNTVRVTQQGHGFTNLDEVFIDVTSIAGYPAGTVNGIPLSEFQDLVTIAFVDADTYDITVSSSATTTGNATTLSGSITASPTIAGIPLTELNGNFEISNVTSTSYQITVTSAATATATSVADSLRSYTPTNGGSVTAELGLTNSLNGGSFSSAQSTGATGPAYDASDVTKNMASGSITPQFPINIPVFDSLGSSHNIRVGFVKTGINTYAAEVYAVPATDVSSSFPNGLLASGNIVFNGDGSLRSIDSALTSPIAAVWENGAAASSITVNWGTAGIIGTGDTDGMTQFDSSDNLNFANQNGVPVGELIGVEIGEDGTVTARFSNGEEQNLYKIPLASFANPNGLGAITGNVYIETRDSGTVNLRESGTSGVGTFQSSALEGSDVELAGQLTTMIIAQQSYKANTQVIQAADELLEELTRI